MRGFILRVALGFVGILILLSLPLSFYVVQQNEYVAVFQFGRIVHVTDTPGIKFKLPVIQTTQHISKKIHLYDMPASGVITRDKKSMIADNFVMWRVSDPVKYVQTLNAIEPRAQERIEAAVYNAVKNAISSMSQDEVIEARGERLSRIRNCYPSNTNQGTGPAQRQQVRCL